MNFTFLPTPCRKLLTRTALGSQMMFLGTCIGAYAMGCGADATTSTDTGNPPLVDQHKIRIEATDSGVQVEGDKGAISPGGAEVKVTNLSGGASASAVSAADGSFSIEIAGDLEDEYEVRATEGTQVDAVKIEPGAQSDDNSVDDNSDDNTVDDDSDDNSPSDETLDDAAPPDDNEPTLAAEYLLSASEGFSLVADTQVRLRFDESSIGFSAGCNSHFGEFELCQDQLCVDGFGSTEIGCEPERQAQDEWLAEFLSGTPSLSLTGSKLILSNAEATLTFQDAEVAEPDAELTDGTWSIDTWVEGNAASNRALERTPTIDFNTDGTIDFSTPCNRGGGSYEVNNSEMTLSNMSWQEMGCPTQADAEAEQLMFEVLGAGTSTFEIDFDRLTIRRGDVGVSATLER